MLSAILQQAPPYVWWGLVIAILIRSAGAAASRILRELPGVIDARGRYRLAMTASRFRCEKSTPSNLTASK
jgi:hypothetical protein